MSRVLLMIVLFAFGLYSAYAVAEIGYVGIFASHAHIAGLQVLADLVIALSLVMAWMVHDASIHGRRVWPFILCTLAFGSIGPLLYLLVGRARTASPLAA